MAQYIDKSVVVAEIRNKVDSYKGGGIISISVLKQHCEDFIDFLDTLEVKEVDLEKELDKYTADNFWALEGNNESPYLLEKDDMLKVAKHFFELGLKAQKGE